MAIQTKRITVDDKVYKIKQHPATEGCAILERFGNAVVAFAVAQEHIVVDNKLPNPFNKLPRVAIDGRWLAVSQFLDKIAAPDETYERFTQPDVGPVGKLTVREVLAGKTLGDRHSEAVERVPSPLSYLIHYKATEKQTRELDIEAVFEEFFRYITYNDEPLDVDTLTIPEVAHLLSAVIEYNFLHLWTKERFSLKEGYSGAGAIQPPRSLDGIGDKYSQSNVIYNILRCSQPLATLCDLSTVMSVSDAFDANETALRIYFEDSEMRKEAERQAKTNGG